MLNVGVIGIGNCGNQIARLAFTEVQCDAFAINTSEKDLSTIKEDFPKRCVGTEKEGSGKDRAAAKQYLENDIMALMRDEEFIKFMEKKDVVLIASSSGGGSGSGIAPVMSNIIREAFRASDGSELIVILIGVLPRLSEGYSTQVNSLEYAHEVFDIIDGATYMLYDNNAYKDETSYRVLEQVNDEIIQNIKVIQCKYNNPTPYDSIDEKDMKTLLKSPGLIFITSLLNLKEKDVDESSIEDLFVERLKKSAHVEMQRDGIISRTGLITNLSPKMNENFDTHIGAVRAFVGEPTEEFLHIAVNSEKTLENSAHLIITGLSKPADRIEKIKDRISEIEEKNDALTAADTDLTEDELARMNARRGRRSSETQTPSQVDIGSIMAKFK